MASIRARLTVAYATALAGTLVTFGGALYVARQANAYQELATQALVEADRVIGALQAAKASGVKLTAEVDTGGAGRPRFSAPTRGMRETLERVPGYFMVLDADDRLLYPSFAVRTLAADDQGALQRAALRLRGPAAAVVTLTADSLVGGRILLRARRDVRITPEVAHVVAGFPTAAAELPVRLLLGTVLVVVPFVFLLSVFAAYVITGRALRPIDRLIEGVEAITDGRSLHRRLGSEFTDDELARLAGTLNAMIGRLEHSFAALRRFTADASHELRTPLTVMRADVERAMNQRSTARDRAEALEEALQECARMSDLVDALLTLARADEGRFDLHREPVALGPFVEDVYETALILGEGAGVSVHLPVLEDATVLADPQRLRQLFLNLVSNAIKYTPSGGQVDLSLRRREQGEVAFLVRDTGIGISATDLPHVFERFFRADKVRSRAAERTGFGLGLAIAHWIAQAHGGSIAAQSRMGRGSLFTVTLPTVEPADVAPSLNRNVVHGEA